MEKIELSFDMLAKASELIKVLTAEQIDISRILNYEHNFNRLERLEAEDLEKLGIETIAAMDLVANAKYIAEKLHKECHIEYDRVSATRYFDGALEFLKKKGDVKDSDAARKRFVDQDPEYLVIKSKRDSWLALTLWLDNKYNSFLNKHLWVKKEIDRRIARRGTNE